jgi:hypothetical protein
MKSMEKKNPRGMHSVGVSGVDSGTLAVIPWPRSKEASSLMTRILVKPGTYRCGVLLRGAGKDWGPRVAYMEMAAKGEKFKFSDDKVRIMEIAVPSGCVIVADPCYVWRRDANAVNTNPWFVFWGLGADEAAEKVSMQLGEELDAPGRDFNKTKRGVYEVMLDGAEDPIIGKLTKIINGVKDTVVSCVKNMDNPMERAFDATGGDRHSGTFGIDDSGKRFGFVASPGFGDGSYQVFAGGPMRAKGVYNRVLVDCGVEEEE